MKEKEELNLEIKLLKLSLIKPHNISEEDNEKHLENKNLNKIFSMSKKLKKKNIPESYGNYALLVSIILTDEEILPNIVEMEDEEINNMYSFILEKINKNKEKERTNKSRKSTIEKLVEAQEKGLSIDDIEKMHT